jgi:hypothetical protein
MNTRRIPIPMRTFLLAGLLAACAAQPATPEQRLEGERRLLAPFLTGREIGCGELLVELTGNFDQNVGRPAVDRSLHTVAREQGNGFQETIWTNVSGNPDSAFELAIGEPTSAGAKDWVRGQQTRFRVVNQLRIRVREQGALTLSATASGPIVVVKDASGPPRDVARFAIADGMLQR